MLTKCWTCGLYRAGSCELMLGCVAKALDDSVTNTGEVRVSIAIAAFDNTWSINSWQHFTKKNPGFPCMLEFLLRRDCFRMLY